MAWRRPWDCCRHLALLQSAPEAAGARPGMRGGARPAPGPRRSGGPSLRLTCCASGGSACALASKMGRRGAFFPLHTRECRWRASSPKLRPHWRQGARRTVARSGMAAPVVGSIGASVAVGAGAPRPNRPPRLVVAPALPVVGMGVLSRSTAAPPRGGGGPSAGGGLGPVTTTASSPNFGFGGRRRRVAKPPGVVVHPVVPCRFPRGQPPRGRWGCCKGSHSPAAGDGPGCRGLRLLPNPSTEPRATPRVPTTAPLARRRGPRGLHALQSIHSSGAAHGPRVANTPGGPTARLAR